MSADSSYHSLEYVYAHDALPRHSCFHKATPPEHFPYRDALYSIDFHTDRTYSAHLPSTLSLDSRTFRYAGLYLTAFEGLPSPLNIRYSVGEVNVIASAVLQEKLASFAESPHIEHIRWVNTFFSNLLNASKPSYAFFPRFEEAETRLFLSPLHVRTLLFERMHAKLPLSYALERRDTPDPIDSVSGSVINTPHGIKRVDGVIFDTPHNVNILRNTQLKKPLPKKRKWKQKKTFFVKFHSLAIAAMDEKTSAPRFQYFSAAKCTLTGVKSDLAGDVVLFYPLSEVVRQTLCVLWLLHEMKLSVQDIRVFFNAFRPFQCNDALLALLGPETARPLKLMKQLCARLEEGPRALPALGNCLTMETNARLCLLGSAVLQYVFAVQLYHYFSPSPHCSAEILAGYCQVLTGGNMKSRMAENLRLEVGLPKRFREIDHGIGLRSIRYGLTNAFVGSCYLSKGVEACAHVLETGFQAHYASLLRNIRPHKSVPTQINILPLLKCPPSKLPTAKALKKISALGISAVDSFLKDINAKFKSLHMKLEPSVLVLRAFTHSSFFRGRSDVPTTALLAWRHYDNLEFLGDSVLSYCVTTTLFKKFPTLEYSEFHAEKIDLCCNARLHKLCIRLGFDKLILRHEDVEDLKMYADVVEALIGVFYLEKGIEAAEKFVAKYVITKSYMKSMAEKLLKRKRRMHSVI